MIETRRKGAEQRIAQDPDRDAALTSEQPFRSRRTSSIMGEALANHQDTLEKLDKKKNRAARDEAKSQNEAQAIVRLLTLCSRVFLAMGDKENAHRARQDAMQLHRRVSPTNTAS